MISQNRIFLLLVFLILVPGLFAQEGSTVKSKISDTIQSNELFPDTLSGSDGPGLMPSGTKIDLSKVNIANNLTVPEFLQGRVSGLDITRTSGEPGSEAMGWIRASGFLNQNSPLIVIDGIPRANPDNLMNIYTYYTEDIRSILPVPMEDIRSIEVLKDGFSTSLYGGEGAAGVISIRTRKGFGQKLGVTYQFNQSLVARPSYIPMLNGNSYAMEQIEALHNAYGTFTLPPELSYDPNNPDYYNYSANTDWVRAVTKQGSESGHFLSICGSNEKNRYYASLNSNNQTGTVINTRYNRLSGRMNLEHSFTRNLNLVLNLGYSGNAWNGNTVPSNGLNILQMAFMKAPNMSIQEYDSTGNKTGTYFLPTNSYQGTAYEYYNPVAVSDYGYSKSTLDEFVPALHLQYRLKNWLELRESFSYTLTTAVSDAFLPAYALTSDPLSKDVGNKADMQYHQARNEFQVNLAIPFKNKGKNQLNGSITWITQGIGYSIQSENDPVIRINNRTDHTRNAVVSIISYTLSNRYILNANARTEKFSSKQMNAQDRNYGVSLGWQFSNEPFVRRIQFMDYGLIRAGWSYAEYHPAFYGMNFLNLNYNEKRQTGIFNAALELGILHNRIRFTADYDQHQATSDNPNAFGTSSILGIQVNGWEYMLDAAMIESRQVKWTLQFNMSHYQQTYAKITGYNTVYGQLVNGEYFTHIHQDESPGNIYGLIRNGVYPTNQDAVATDRQGNILYNTDGSPVITTYKGMYAFKGGDSRYRDMNYDGVIDENDLVYLGNTFPKFTGGAGSIFSYRNITLSIQSHYHLGNKLIRQANLSMETMNDKNNLDIRALNRWRVDGQQGYDLLPRAYLNNPANNLGSDFYVESGNYLRLDYISLGYTLKQDICRKINLRSIYLSLSAQRAFTMTGYNGLDPETGTYLPNDGIRVLPPKIYTFTIRIEI